MTVAPAPNEAVGGPGEGVGATNGATPPGTGAASPAPVRPGRRRTASRLLTPLLAAAIFVAGLSIMGGQAARVGYTTDEGQFVLMAAYYDVVFRDRQLSGVPWEENYWTLTQPPISRYVMGAAIRASGNEIPPLDVTHRIEEVRGPTRARYLDPAYYRDEKRLAEERRVERPRPEVLQAARVPMAVFGAGAAVLLFLIGRTLGGLVGGLVAAALLLATPLALQLIPRAHAEAPLMFFTLLGLHLALLAARAATASRTPSGAPPQRAVAGPSVAPNRPVEPNNPVIRSAPLVILSAPLVILSAAKDLMLTVRPVAVQPGFVADTLHNHRRGMPRYLILGALTGVVAGVAGATKLSAVLAMATLGAFACWALAVRWWAARRAATAHRDAGVPMAASRDAEASVAVVAADRSWRWAALAAALSLAVFVAVNPFLWQDPLGRTLAMLRFRQQEMFGQRALNPELAVPEDLSARLGLLLSEAFVERTPIGRRTGLPVEAALALFGAGWLAWRAVRARRAGGLVGPEALTLAWVLATIVGTAPNLGIEWDRYYLPTLTVGLILVGVGADALVAASGRATRRRPPRHPEQPPGPTRSPGRQAELARPDVSAFAAVSTSSAMAAPSIQSATSIRSLLAMCPLTSGS